MLIYFKLVNAILHEGSMFTQRKTVCLYFWWLQTLDNTKRQRTESMICILFQQLWFYSKFYCCPLTFIHREYCPILREFCEPQLLGTDAAWLLGQWSQWMKIVKILNQLGPVVQSIVSLMSSFRGQLVKYFTTLSPNTLIFFVENMWETFALLLTFFQQKNTGMFEKLTSENLTKCCINDIVSFEQPGPDLLTSL